MKIYICDENTPTHRIVKLNAEEHSHFEYLGDLDDDELREFLKSVKDDIDIEKNLKLMKYYGYLHIFVIKHNN